MERIAKIAKTISGHIDKAILQEYLEKIYALEKDFSISSFKNVADYCFKTCESIGLSVQKIDVPLDGESRYADWTMPMAWDRGDVCLKIIQDDQAEQLLADGNEIPHHLIQWSAGTSPDGVFADLVLISDIDRINKNNVRGKFVLSTLGVTEIKRKVADCEGIGILSYNSRPNSPDNAVPWVNCWSDDPDGWGFTAKDKNLIGFSISNEQGDQLRQKLLAGHKIKLFARAETQLLKDNLPLVQAEIKGTGPGSVLLLAHLFEPGANDNASGASALLCIAKALSCLIEREILPKPSRSIKFLFTSEIYGTLGYFNKIAKDSHEILASLNVDSIGRFDQKTGKMNIHTVPDSSISFINLFMEKLVDIMKLTDQTTFLPFTLADTVSNDPQIGIPCPYVGVVDQYWHTSLDVPATIDYHILSQYTALSGVYAYCLAIAGKEEAKWLIELSRDHIKNQSKQGERTASEHEYAFYLFSEQVKSVKRIDSSEKTLREIDDLLNRYHELAKSGNHERSNKRKVTSKETVLKRRFTGPLSFMDIPPAERRKSNINLWDPVLQKALFWIDGERPIDEICRLTELEQSARIPYLKEALETILANKLLKENY